MRLACLLVALVSAGCGASSTPNAVTQTADASGLRYRFELEPSLRAMHVSVCSERGLPSRLLPIHAEGGERFVRAELEREGGDREPLAGPTIEIPPGRAGCVHYEVSLRGGSGSADAPLGFPDAVYAPTSSWLWAPEPRDPDGRYEAEIVLPAGMHHSALFVRDPETGRLSFGEAAFDFVSYAAFGELRLLTVAAPGGCIEVASIGDSPPTDVLTEWITVTSDAASRAFGVLPAPVVSVVTLPIGVGAGSGDPLAFGMAAHGERPTLLAYMWTDADRERLRRDWVAVHELSHLGHAFLGGASAWLTEGLATYYETLLRARAGWVTAEIALEQLDGGMVRGERGGTGRSLREESEERHGSGAYDRVYWAGAAIALSIDVALRAEGSSLDEALLRAYPRRNDSLTDRELLLAMDGGSPGTATRIAEPWMASSVFPDLGPAYAALGIRRGAGGLSFEASGAALRAALLNESPPLASNPVDCTF